MKYVAPGRKYQVLIEPFLPCKQFDDGSFDFRVSSTGIYIFFIVIESGGTFFVGFIIEYLEKLNAIILIIYSSQPFNVVCEHQVFALRGSD